MALEDALDKHAEALHAQTIAINHLVVVVGKYLNIEAPAAKKEAPAAKKEAPPVDELDDFEDITAEIPALPEGERDEAYFAKYVRPALKVLSDANRPGLLELLEHFGAGKASEIKAADWDEAVHMASRA